MDVATIFIGFSWTASGESGLVQPTIFPHPIIRPSMFIPLFFLPVDPTPSCDPQTGFRFRTLPVFYDESGGALIMGLDPL